MAKQILEKAKSKGVDLVLPVDVAIADKYDADAKSDQVDMDAQSAGGIQDGWMGLDIGPKSIDLFREKLLNSSTVVWNGPMGVFEFDAFSKGTFAVAETMAELSTQNGGITVIGGGDSVAAVEKSGLAESMSHISTGGGASLELLEGKVLPGVNVLDEM